MEHLLHAQLDAAAPDALAAEGGVVAELVVVRLVLRRDRPHVAEDVGAERSVRVHPPPVLDDRDAREVLDALVDGDGDGLLDALLDRHRLVPAVALGVVALLHLVDGHLEPSGQAGEQLGPVGVAVHHLPVDADREHPLVVGEDAPVDVDDAAALGEQAHGLGLAGVDRLLQRLGLHGLQEPQAGADRTEQQRGDEGEDAQARAQRACRRASSSTVIDLIMLPWELSTPDA